MAYGNVGLTTGNPHGTLTASQAISSTVGLNGTLTRQITWVDDAAPGTPYTTHADYKRVTIKVVRRDGKVLTTQTSFVSPFDASDYGGPNVGSLQVTIQDMASTTVVTGVTVSIAGGPSGTASDVTDATGVASFPALQPNPASGPTKCYEITVTPPAGYVVYSSDVPASCGSSPADAVITAAQTTSKTIRIYKPAAVTFNVTRWKALYTAATTTVNLSASIGGSPATAGPYTVPTTGTLTTAATFLPSSAWTVTATSGALTAPAQTIPIPTLAGYPTTSAATVAIAFPDTTITVKKRTTVGCTVAPAGVGVNVSGGPDSLVGLTGVTNGSGQATFDLRPGPNYTITELDHAGRRHVSGAGDRVGRTDRHRPHRHVHRERQRGLPVSTLMTRIARDRRGFTLVEMLVGMVVLGIVLASMASLLSAIYNTGTQTVEAGTLQDEARSGVDMLVSDLRQAYTGDSATPFVASMSSTAITFYSPDRQQPFHLRKIAYQQSGTTLQRASRHEHRHGRSTLARADDARRLAERCLLARRQPRRDAALQLPEGRRHDRDRDEGRRAGDRHRDGETAGLTEQSIDLPVQRRPEGLSTMRAPKLHPRDEQGIALVLVIIIGLVLTTVSAVLRDRARQREHELESRRRAPAVVPGRRGRPQLVCVQADRGRALLLALRRAGRVDAQGSRHQHARHRGQPLALRPQLDVSERSRLGRGRAASEQLRVQPPDRPAERRGLCDPDEPALRRDHDHRDGQAARRREQVRLARDPGDDPAELDLRLLPDRQRRRRLREHHDHERQGLCRRRHQPRRHGHREPLRRWPGHRLDHVRRGPRRPPTTTPPPRRPSARSSRRSTSARSWPPSRRSPPSRRTRAPARSTPTVSTSTPPRSPASSPTPRRTIRRGY